MAMAPSIVPIFDNCFFYYPLRTGLLIWGYLTLLLYILLDGTSITACFYRIIYHYNEEYDYQHRNLNSVYAVFAVTCIVAAITLTFNVIFIIGVHKNHIQKLKICLYFGIVKLVFNTCIIILCNILNAHNERISKWIYWHMDPSTYYMFIQVPAIASIYVIFHIYFLLLLRSLYISIRDDSEQRGFVNTFEYEINAYPDNSNTVTVAREKATPKFSINKTVL